MELILKLSIQNASQQLQQQFITTGSDRSHHIFNANLSTSPGSCATGSPQPLGVVIQFSCLGRLTPRLLIPSHDQRRRGKERISAGFMISPSLHQEDGNRQNIEDWAV